MSFVINKMHYFKLLICGGILFLLAGVPVYAENWTEVNYNNENIMLDIDSIKYNSKNNSLYYNVKYNEKGTKDSLVLTIQSANGMAGTVSTCKYLNYKNNKCTADTNTNKIAPSMKEVTHSSFLYNADLVANSKYKASKIAQEANQNSDFIPTGKYGRSSFETNDYVSKSGIIAVKEPDFGPYMRDLQRRIKRNWNPPKGIESKSVVLLFKIAKDGSLLSYSVYESSGIKAVDYAAIEAVKSAAPFRPLPDEFKNQSIDIQYSFDYSVFDSSKY